MTPPLPAGRWPTIFADPPWRFQTWDGKRAVPSRAAGGDPYRPMRSRDLRRLDVAALAAPDAVLLLWAPDAMFEQALQLGQAWGFRYKTVAFVWLKADPRQAPLQPRISLGYWTRKETELCLLLTRGAPSRISRSVRQVIVELPREHSRKPETAYRRTEQLVAGPYLELFARQRRPGWESWGDQVDHFEAAA